jgi:hypothetical protein
MTKISWIHFAMPTMLWSIHSDTLKNDTQTSVIIWNLKMKWFRQCPTRHMSDTWHVFNMKCWCYTIIMNILCLNHNLSQRYDLWSIDTLNWRFAWCLTPDTYICDYIQLIYFLTVLMVHMLVSCLVFVLLLHRIWYDWHALFNYK